MITVANCLTLDEAMGLRTRLESAGIPVFIPDEATASVAPYLLMTRSGVRVQVLEEHADEARQLMNHKPETGS